MSRNEADPVTVAEYCLANGYLRVKLDNQLDVAFEAGRNVSSWKRHRARMTHEGRGTGGPRVTRAVSPAKPFAMVSRSRFFGVFIAGVGVPFAASSRMEL